jgi:hypothetical protein
MFKGILAVSLLCCGAAHATDITYTFSGGVPGAATLTGVFADKSETAVFPYPKAFTVLDTNCPRIERFDVSKPANQVMFGEGFQDMGNGSATVNGNGVVLNASIPLAYPSGDIRGLVWGWTYTRTGSSTGDLTIYEMYEPYGAGESGYASKTYTGVKLEYPMVGKLIESVADCTK